MALSDKAQLLHETMSKEPSGTLFEQENLQKVINAATVVDLLLVAQELIDNKLVKLVKQGDELKFQAVNEQDASKVKNMSDDEAMIYSYIEASGREGIWTKTIKAKTNLHQHIVVRCLKSLENQRYVKAVKSVKHPTRKIYMLYNLQPSIEVTGGPWFTDSELDTEFIDSLLIVIWRFVATKTYPGAFNPSNRINPLQASYPSHHSNYPSVDDIMSFIQNNRVTNIELAINDVRSLCDVLVYEDKLEHVPQNTDTFKATWQSVLEAGYGIPQGEDPYSVRESSFSIFENHAVLAPSEEDADVIYVDSWIHN